MSAWYIFNAMGFYPVCPGSNNYAKGQPDFDKIKISMGDKTFTVIANNRSDENKYVQAVYVDDEKLTEPHITHDDIVS